MPETAFPPFIVPGTFIRVRAEGLISAGGIPTGNIGIVGTAASGVNETHILSDYEGAVNIFGAYDAMSAGTLNLTRSLELLFRTGARKVFARGLAAGASQTDFGTALGDLINDDINILVAPELTTSVASTELATAVNNAENASKDIIAVVGLDDTTLTAKIAGDDPDPVPDNGRIIATAPGVVAFDSVAGAAVSLSGTYTAAAFAGKLSTLAPQSSITNKAISGVGSLTRRFSYGELTTLLDPKNGRVAALEERRGVRVVRGLSTNSGPYTQITTRRIVDFAKAGIRRVADPFIGRLNNIRVRGAMQGAIDGFLTTMVQDEALTGYSLQVTATRADEIENKAIVNAVLLPTFSIDFIAVTLVLE